VDAPEWQRLERQAGLSEQRHLLKRAHKAVSGETRDELQGGGRTGSLRGTTLATSAFGDGCFGSANLPCAQLLLDALAEARDRLLLGRVATHERVRRALQEVFEDRSLVTCVCARDAPRSPSPFRARRRV